MDFAISRSVSGRFTLVSLIFLLVSACGGGGGGASGGGSNDMEETGFIAAPDSVALSLEPIKTFRLTWDAVEGVTHYRVLENPDGSSGFSQIGSDIDTGTETYDHLVPVFRRINAQYIVQACNGATCNDSSVVSVLGTLEDIEGYFKAGNAEAEDHFGFAVSLSADGNTLAVGASNEDNANTGINPADANGASASGAVYIYSRNGNTWTEQAYIKASNADAGDVFGYSVSLNATGTTLAVGAYLEDNAFTGVNPSEDVGVASGSGAVYVYIRSGTTWTEQAYIKASNAQTLDMFGHSVSVSADGDTLVVGARGEDNANTGVNPTDANGASRSGAVYVYTRSGATWAEQAYIKASNAEAGDLFGFSVSVSADGATLAVGARDEDNANTGINPINANGASGSGAVYVYSRSGTTWSEQAYIKAGNALAGDAFGNSVSLGANGDTLAVGAYFEDNANTGINPAGVGVPTNYGAAYVYRRSGTSWVEQAYIKASNAEPGDEFGYAVSLSSDGDTLAVGAREEANANTGINPTDIGALLGSGAVYVYSRSFTAWSEEAYIKASNAEVDDEFGHAVSVSANGDTLAVGAWGEGNVNKGVNPVDAIGAPASGAVYLY